MSRELLTRTDERRLAPRRRVDLPGAKRRATDPEREHRVDRLQVGASAPLYAVELSDAPFELRFYRAAAVAETVQDGARRPSLRRGSRALLAYLAGGNAAERKIATTAPIGQEPGPLRGWRVRFTMPAGETPETLPAPSDSGVALRFTGEERLAVVRFSGFATARRLGREELRLRDWAKRRRLPLALTARHLYYDGPMSLPWRRRTEVAVAVK